MLEPLRGAIKRALPEKAPRPIFRLRTSAEGKPDMMRLNDDLNLRTALHAASMDWVPSPARGVERRMLYRVGDEIARATSLVRFAPDSRFPLHTHGGGEEILVLEGVFSDETGDYPAGSYLRNPPGTAHAPSSRAGCVLFVKLWQFRADDAASVTLRPEDIAAREADGAAVLFENPDETVSIQNWPPGAAILLPNRQGLELLILSGAMEADGETFEPLSWLRLPPPQDFRARAGAQGVRLWIKQGPLLQPGVCPL
jgi:quercetin dioxygenase-like cupin family protein